jgi:hypothetical protein
MTHPKGTAGLTGGRLAECGSANSLAEIRSRRFGWAPRVRSSPDHVTLLPRQGGALLPGTSHRVDAVGGLSNRISGTNSSRDLLRLRSLYVKARTYPAHWTARLQVKQLDSLAWQPKFSEKQLLNYLACRGNQLTVLNLKRTL